MASTISFDKPSFSVDSRNRQNCDTCSIEDFEICVELPPNNKFNQVSLSSVVIPKSYYNVTDGRFPGETSGRVLGYDNGTFSTPPNGFFGQGYQHNQFCLSEGTSSGIITIDLANYNSNNFPVILKNLLEARSASTSTTDSNLSAWATTTTYQVNRYVTNGGSTYRCILAHTAGGNLPQPPNPPVDDEPGVGAVWTTYWTLIRVGTTVFGNNFIYDITYPDILTQADTKKWTFTVSNNGSTQPIFYFPTLQPINEPANSGARNKKKSVRSTEIMGMDPSQNNGQRVFSGNTLTSDFQVDFELTKYIVIKSDICLDQGNNTPDNAIIGIIPVIGVEDGGVINYELQQLEDESKYLANNRKNLYRFSLFDDHNEPLILNGINWFIKLFVYEYNPFFEVAINDIKIRQLGLANQKLLRDVPSNQQVNQPQPPIE